VQPCTSVDRHHAGCDKQHDCDKQDSLMSGDLCDKLQGRLSEYCHWVWCGKLEWCGYPMVKNF